VLIVVPNGTYEFAIKAESHGSHGALEEALSPYLAYVIVMIR
jgi:hypothetical protein